jgi:hypothetical protein
MPFDHKNFHHIYIVPIKLLGDLQIAATTSIILYFRCNDSDGDCHMKFK